MEVLDLAECLVDLGVSEGRRVGEFDDGLLLAVHDRDSRDGLDSYLEGEEGLAIEDGAVIHLGETLEEVRHEVSWRVLSLAVQALGLQTVL